MRDIREAEAKQEERRVSALQVEEYERNERARLGARYTPPAPVEAWNAPAALRSPESYRIIGAALVGAALLGAAVLAAAAVSFATRRKHQLVLMRFSLFGGAALGVAAEGVMGGLTLVFALLFGMMAVAATQPFFLAFGALFYVGMIVLALARTVTLVDLSKQRVTSHLLTTPMVRTRTVPFEQIVSFELVMDGSLVATVKRPGAAEDLLILGQVLPLDAPRGATAEAMQSLSTALGGRLHGAAARSHPAPA